MADACKDYAQQVREAAYVGTMATLYDTTANFA